MVGVAGSMEIRSRYASADPLAQLAADLGIYPIKGAFSEASAIYNVWRRMIGVSKILAFIKKYFTH